MKLGGSAKKLVGKATSRYLPTFPTVRMVRNPGVTPSRSDLPTLDRVPRIFKFLDSSGWMRARACAMQSVDWDIHIQSGFS